MTSPTKHKSVPYNYPHFRPNHYDLASFNGPAIGSPFPNLGALKLDGTPIDWSELHGTRVVIETASATCPMYVKGVPAMNRLAARHPDTTFLVLYVREAHPGESVRRHDTIQQKLKAGRLLRQKHDDERQVLVDNLEGTAHRVLGGLPNMVYILDPDGTVVFRGDWTDTDAVGAILDGSASLAEAHREHFPPAKPSPRVAIRTLLTGGWIALFDFAIGVPGLIGLHHRADTSYRSKRTSASTTGP